MHHLHRRDRASGQALQRLTGRPRRRPSARLGPVRHRPWPEPGDDQCHRRRPQVLLLRHAGMPRACGRAARAQETPQAAALHDGGGGRAPDPCHARPPVPRRHRHRLWGRASHLRDRGHQDRRHQVGQEAATHSLRQRRHRANGPAATRGHRLPARLLEEHVAAAGNLAILRRLARCAYPNRDPEPGLQEGARQGRHRQPLQLSLPASFGRDPSS